MEGEIIEWLKPLNAPLHQDEPVVVVMTDKATVELPAPRPGRLAKQYLQAGQIAIKDKPIYDIEFEDAQAEAEPMPQEREADRNEAEPSIKIQAEAKPVSKPTAKPTAPGQKALAVPPVRKLARDLGLEINLIPGTGKDGRVTVEDIRNFHGAGSQFQKQERTSIPQLPGDYEQPLIGIRQLMAKRMAESNVLIPHFSYFEQVDATRLVQLRQKIKIEAEHAGIHLTYMPFFIRALSLCLKRFPLVNSSLDIDRNKLIIHTVHNVGIAISTAHGLIVPVLKNAEALTLKEVITLFDDLKNKALHNQLHSSDMKDATITISNFGVLGGGGLWATPIINYPEVAILAVARIQKQPIVKNEVVIIRDLLHLSWSFDHRIIDGDLAASFSHHFATLIQNPAPLL